MVLKYLNLFMAFMGSLAISESYAQSYITGCNGKNYGIGDTLVVGKPALSGYLFIRTVNEQGDLSPMPDRDIAGLKVTITSIPEYDEQ